MPRFTRAADLEKHLKKALDALQYNTIVNTQAQLGSDAVSPVKTGRLRSSWFASEGPGTGAVAPEGANSPNTDATGLRVDATKSYTLQNALPYAQRVALEGHVKAKGPNWFIDFVNTEVPAIYNDTAKLVKREYEL